VSVSHALRRPWVLFVSPYSVFDSNPTLQQAVQQFAQSGAAVAILSPPLEHRLEGDAVWYLLPRRLYRFESASLRRLPRVVWDLCRQRQWRSVVRTLRFLIGLRKSRVLVLGVDPAGVIVAAKLAGWLGAPLGYLSFEILFQSDLKTRALRRFKQGERAAAGRAGVALVQDKERAQALCTETGLQADRLELVPVAPAASAPVKSFALRESLGIPPGQKILLYCGNVEDWSIKPCLSAVVAQLPESWCLVVHSQFAVREETRALVRASPKLILSNEWKTEPEVLELAASADVGWAAYTPNSLSWMSGKNLELLGAASGKIGLYARAGLPMLCSGLPSLKHLLGPFGCAAFYDTLAEVPAALQSLADNSAVHRAGAIRLYQERLDPRRGMQAFCGRSLRLLEGTTC